MSAAAEMSMEDFRAKFQETTGKTWESADKKEKRAFVRKQVKIASLKARKNSTKIFVAPDNDKSSNLKRTVNVDVRKKFFAKYQKDWKEGTPEEQETFLEEYKAQKLQEDQISEQAIQAEKDRLLQVQQQREADIREAEQKKLEEEHLKEERIRILNEKREAEKRKLAEQMEKMKAKQEEIKAKREQSIRRWSNITHELRRRVSVPQKSIVF